MPPESSWLAYAGAIVTLVSLIFGTFTQQLLAIRSFPVINEPEKQTGPIPPTVAWDSYEGSPEAECNQF